jgi:muramoyltetrapeptide carboxypeptidase
VSSLLLFSPSGAVPRASTLHRAERRLRDLGFDVTCDEAVLARAQRFAGDEATRRAALHRVADAAPSIAMATRGGYGLTRLLDAIRWKQLAKSIARGTRWVGHSDLTALQMGLLAATGAASWAGPMALADFGRADDDGGVDEDTRDVLLEAMDGRLHALGFRTAPGLDGLGVRGTLWGGNLTVLLSLLGTRHWPKVKGGVLFVEDVGEHPYRIERMLLQLHQAGVLAAQKAVLLGAFSDFKPAPNDRGYGLKQVVAALRAATRTPVLTGLPFGHVQPKLTLPVGRRVELFVEGRNVLLAW